MNYRTRDGDMIDELAWRIYGREGMAMAIYDANPGLADYGPVLPAGLLIELPDRAKTEPVATTIRLWGAS